MLKVLKKGKTDRPFKGRTRFEFRLAFQKICHWLCLRIGILVSLVKFSVMMSSFVLDSEVWPSYSDIWIAEWQKLPPTIWSMICRVTETSHPYNPSNLSMEPVDISHIRKEQPRLSAKIPWVFALTEEIDSYMPCDEQVNLSLDPDSIYFQSDSKRKSPRNHDPEKRKKEAPAGRSSKSLAAQTGRHSKSTCSLQTPFLRSFFSLALALRHSSSIRANIGGMAFQGGGCGCSCRLGSGGVGGRSRSQLSGEGCGEGWRSGGDSPRWGGSLTREAGEAGPVSPQPEPAQARNGGGVDGPGAKGYGSRYAARGPLYTTLAAQDPAAELLQGRPGAQHVVERESPRRACQSRRRSSTACARLGRLEAPPKGATGAIFWLFLLNIIYTYIYLVLFWL